MSHRLLLGDSLVSLIMARPGEKSPVPGLPWGPGYIPRAGGVRGAGEGRGRLGSRGRVGVRAGVWDQGRETNPKKQQQTQQYPQAPQNEEDYPKVSEIS